jgi:SH3-like domain-containing protein
MIGGQETSVVADIDGAFTGRMDRRRVLRLMAGAGAAAVLGGVLTSMPASAAAGPGYVTITSLNLRSKASTSGKVLAVMPLGSFVKELDGQKNGFLKVEYQGIVGWAYMDYLAPSNTDLAPPITAEAKTTSSVNFRKGPDTGDAIIQTLKKGTWVETSDTVVDGFRHCRVNGTRGWIYDDYLGGYIEGIEPGQELTTTAAVNMREKASTSSKVLRVIPAGETVTAMAQSENGFRSVAWGQYGGWVYEDYLA